MTIHDTHDDDGEYQDTRNVNTIITKFHDAILASLKQIPTTVLSSKNKDDVLSPDDSQAANAAQEEEENGSPETKHNSRKDEEDNNTAQDISQATTSTTEALQSTTVPDNTRPFLTTCHVEAMSSKWILSW